MNPDTEKRLGSEGASKFAGAGHAPHSKNSNDVDKNRLKIFVGGLSNNITDADLRSYFSRYGEVSSVFIPRDHISRMSRGFAFIVFKKLDSVRRVPPGSHVIRNQNIEVEKAEELKVRNKRKKKNT